MVRSTKGYLIDTHCTQKTDIRQTLQEFFFYRADLSKLKLGLVGLHRDTQLDHVIF